MGNRGRFFYGQNEQKLYKKAAIGVKTGSSFSFCSILDTARYHFTNCYAV